MFRLSKDNIRKSRSVTVAGGKRSNSPCGRFSTVNGGDSAVRWKFGTVLFVVVVDAVERDENGTYTSRSEIGVRKPSDKPK